MSYLHHQFLLLRLPIANGVVRYVPNEVYLFNQLMDTFMGFFDRIADCTDSQHLAEESV